MNVIEDLISKVLVLSKDKQVYLVGGYWRDKLLDRPVYDLDLVVAKNAKIFARDLTQKVQGSFVVLDEKNKIYRIVKKQNNKTYFLDIVQMQGENIVADLSRRDFTINALAKEIREIYQGKIKLIDPFSGVKDLQHKIIRKVSDKIFKDDPLRLLRAFRFVAELRFKIDKPTLQLIKKQASRIRLPAKERIRDEIFKVLATDNSAAVISQMDDAGLWDILFPGIVAMKKSAHKFYFHPKGLWQHSWESLAWLEKIFNDLSKYLPDSAVKLNKYLEQETSPGITRKTLLKFVTLFHDIAKPLSAKRIDKKMRFFGHEEKGAKILHDMMQKLRLSNHEITIARKTVGSHMRPGNLTQVKKLTTRAIYRYFRDLGEDGIDTLILSLADRYSYIRISEKPQEIREHCKKVNKILKLYFEEKSTVVPPKLVTGNDVIKICKVSEGPLVGKILNMVEENQANGQIQTRNQAIQFLKRRKK